MHIKRNDTVVAITGKSAGGGKTGKVLQVLPERNAAIVEGLNLVKKALRKSQDNPNGGIGEKEAPIPVSNLAMYCPSCRKGVRVGRAQDGEKKVRKCRKCGHSFDG